MPSIHSIFSEFVAQIVASGKSAIVKAPLGCGKVAMCMMAAKESGLEFVPIQLDLITPTELAKVEPKAGQMLVLSGLEQSAIFVDEAARLLTNVPDGAKVLLCVESVESNAYFKLPVIELKIPDGRDEWSVELLKGVAAADAILADPAQAKAIREKVHGWKLTPDS